MPRIDWEIPEVRGGWRGGVDRFFGPGQTRAELTVQLLGIPVICAVAVWASVPAARSLDLPWWGWLVLVAFAVDGAGGVLTNSTGSAKRWYHRPGTRAQRLAFVVLHVGHVLLIAAFVLRGDWQWFGVNSALLVLCTVVIEFTPLSVKRPVATGLTVAAVVASGLLADVPSGLEWIVLILYVKLLLAHLVPEAPFR